MHNIPFHPQFYPCRSFEKTVLSAYRWLSDNYEHGDCIFLFGELQYLICHLYHSTLNDVKVFLVEHFKFASFQQWSTRCDPCNVPSTQDDNLSEYRSALFTREMRARYRCEFKFLTKGVFLCAHRNSAVRLNYMWILRAMNRKQWLKSDPCKIGRCLELNVLKKHSPIRA